MHNSKKLKYKDNQYRLRKDLDIGIVITKEAKNSYIDIANSDRIDDLIIGIAVTNKAKDPEIDISEVD